MTIQRIRSVDVAADVSVETSAGRLRLSGNGAVLTLTVHDPATLLALGRFPLRLRRSRRARLFHRLTRLLQGLGLQLRIVWGEQEVARLGDRVRGSLLARFFAMRGARIATWQVLRTLLHRPSKL